MTIIVETVKSEKTNMGGIGIVVRVGEVRHHQMTAAIILQDPHNLFEKLIKIIDMLEEAAGMDLINAFIGQKGEAFFKIGNNVDMGQIDPVYADPAIIRQRFYLITATEFNNYGIRTLQDSVKVSFYL